MTTSENDPVFESLLEFLRQSRGFDFTGYKRSSLQRRVRKQMQSHNIDNFGDYLDYLQVHPEEFLPLFNTILINVTGFYRDLNAWQYLQRQVINRNFDLESDRKPIRVWSAGCASGEEAYTLAMILADSLGIEKFRQRVKIYATDLDEEALSQARHASYSDKDLNSFPQELRDRFFEQVGNLYVFRPDLRRAVIFGRHDLVQDAPISRLDLLVCRNTLMYFNAETQGKILQRFHFALKNSGILFLGKAEMLLTHTNLFTPINLQHRIFRPVPKNNRQRTVTLVPLIDDEMDNAIERYSRVREIAFDSVSLAQLIIDLNGNLILANTPARTLFNINLLDLGRPLQDLEISYRPLELRSYLDEIYRTRSNIVVNDVVRNLRDNTTQYLDVQFNLLEDNNGEMLGVSITFTDVTRYHELQEELQRANQELETANEELQSSNEELETTNEELQSTNEELETTNEELQSTNEELETMNEELQSTNEELQTINDELRQRTSELNQANAFLNSILTSLQAGVVVVNGQFNILTWNEEAENMWGLRADEVQEQSILSLDIGLPVEQLREPIRNCLTGTTNSQEITLEAVNRRGKRIQCRISLNPLISHERERQGVILLMEEVEILDQ
ncbi:MCP methyltransferase, CheR-type with PAS/PAC sensor [Gloeothece citriformis PCC 7424]|uniref:protein-glutamate O-methyltransferase n=1 Tax=Gloeothece citriformis (strain PCC 7424) TaxID=65393 RepID=B7KD79_GLOC7|nr:CheR family methyltransferase [Gloeothece citriformis]ACK68899.1 MCP methyltransferase, CheR-type with PAS/PAC sensor [Gloeothece citriformis PCC 7424]